MSKVKEVTPKVMFLLKEWPETRSSDRVLIEALYDYFYNINCQPFNAVMSMTDLPSFESIRRARQKIQEVHPELRAIKGIEDKRIELQEEYLEYAREGGM